MSREEKKAGGAEVAGKKLLWTQQVGLRPHTVTAYERQDKGLTVWLRWTPLSGGGPPDKMSLRFKLRDKITSRRDSARQEEALAMAKEAYNYLLNGKDPRTIRLKPNKSESDALTIAGGLAKALRVPGMYAAEDDHWRDMIRYQAHILAHLPDDVIMWSDLGPTKYQMLWQSLAHWRKKENIRNRSGELAGKRAAELAIVLLAQAGRWLHEDKQIEKLPDMPKKKWREAFDADWARITGDPLVQRVQPRHSPEEMGKLFAGIDAGLGDSRFRLAFRTAGEARIGQAIRCDRTCLDLSRVGAFGLGRLTIPSTGKKKGVIVDLTRELRAAWDHELTKGYLRDLEHAFQARLLRTYPLFPGKRLVGGVARVSATKPITDGAALDMFHELESLCGVEIVEGRGWYGVRRIAADLAEDMENDGRALNAITGHQSDETRRKVYQEKQRDAVLAKAAQARDAARQVAITAARASSAPGEQSASATQSHWEKMREAKRARRRAAHGDPGPRQQSIYTSKVCAKCGTVFTPTGANTKACVSCSPRRVRTAKPTDSPAEAD